MFLRRDTRDWGSADVLAGSSWSSRDLAIPEPESAHEWRRLGWSSYAIRDFVRGNCELRYDEDYTCRSDLGTAA